MNTGSGHLILAALVALGTVPAHSQPAAIPANHSPPTTAQLTARAAADAAQAEAMASASIGQPVPIPDPVVKPGKSSFDPNSIHYPYGRASLGNIDPSSAANPYGPYSSPPDRVVGIPPLAPLFHGGVPMPGRGR